MREPWGEFRYNGMKTNSPIRRSIAAILGLAATSFLLNSTQAATGMLSTEAVHGRAASVISIRPEVQNHGLRVEGTVQRNIPRTVSPGAHVHVQLVDGHGLVLAEEVQKIDVVRLGHSPRGYGARSAPYQVNFPAQPENTAKVRVVFHGECHPPLL
jgi:hypothetical protein